MFNSFNEHLKEKISEISSMGLYKKERPIFSQQSTKILLKNEKSVLNMCSNNYLGLANNQLVIDAAYKGLCERGYGMGSVRFICGTQDKHIELEKTISDFVCKEDTILYSSCFDANGGLFETLFDANDAIISDSLNHASIIDGIRLTKVRRLVYKNNDMMDLESKLKEAAQSRYRAIVTDGVFSMDGIIANLPDICSLAKKYDAIVIVDDSHAVGVLGANGRGTHEYHNVIDQVDIITGTLGKALGAGQGGYISSTKTCIEWLRQKSRPYLFSNSLPPPIVYGSIKAINIAYENSALRNNLITNTSYFRDGLVKLGFEVLGKDHPIVPVLIKDAVLASKFSEELFKHGVFAVAFSYPVVPHGLARIRTQVCATHTIADLDCALSAFEAAKAVLNA